MYLITAKYEFLYKTGLLWHGVALKLCVVLVTLVCQIVSHLYSPATHMSVSVVQNPRTCEQQIIAYEHSLK